MRLEWMKQADYFMYWGRPIDRIEDIPQSSITTPPAFYEHDYKIILNEEFSD